MSIETLKLDYHYGTEAERYSFYRIPKLLFTDKRFSKISIDAKFLYGLMLERLSLSIKNSWLDKDNKVYIYFTLEEAVDKLNCSNTKAVKLFSELDTVKGIGLIERKKQGQGKPTIIYVKNFSSMEKVKSCKNQRSEINKNHEDAENTTNYSQYKRKLSWEILTDKAYNVVDNKNEKVQSVENEISRNTKNESQDFQKTDTNNNYIDFNDIESINLSNDTKKYIDVKSTTEQFKQEHDKKMIDGLIDKKTKQELEDLAYNEMVETETLPYEYVIEPEKMSAAIRVLTKYNFYEKNAKKQKGGELEFSIINLFTEALTEMLTTSGNMNLKGSVVTYSKVYDKLIKYIDFTMKTPSLYSLVETVKMDFTKAMEEYEIKNYLQYMKSCIWNAMQVGDIDVQAFVKKVCG